MFPRAWSGLRPERRCCRRSRTEASSKRSKTTPWSCPSAGKARLRCAEVEHSLSVYIVFRTSSSCICPDSRSKDIVEPLMKPQWYVSCADMGKQAADAVREGRLKIIPDHHLKTWFNWMDNIRYLKYLYWCLKCLFCFRWDFTLLLLPT